MSEPSVNPRVVSWLVRLLVILCAAFVLADFVIHRHAEFSFEAWPGFYALFGFASYCCIVLSAKSLRRFLRRDEDYYGD